MCICAEGTFDVRATAAGAGGGGREVDFESQPNISVGKKTKPNIFSIIYNIIIIDFLFCNFVYKPFIMTFTRCFFFYYYYV